MSKLYKTIEALCKQNHVTITVMCKESGANRASLTDLKMGRKQSLSAATLSKIAAYFKVSVDYLLGNKQSQDSQTQALDTDEIIKFALFDGEKGISDEAYEEVKKFAQYIKEKYKNEKSD